VITKLLKFSVMATLATCVLALTACTDKTNPDNVDRRAIERWNDLIAHQAEKAYDYLTPGFRATQTREAYSNAMNNRPLQWKSAKFNRKECDADRCTVHIDVTYAMTLPGTPAPTQTVTALEETWLLVKGNWYFLPK
jgi:hypothetical protein